ncbi:MAG: delta-60 repeat domain-containing protein, partial [Tepidisphaerales bacterium]
MVPGDLNDRISRLTTLAEPTAQRDGINKLEQYTYLGLGTVVQRVRPAGNSQLSYIGTAAGDAGDKYVGLDRFGRIVDQYWASLDSSPTTLDEFKYGYDNNGNPIYKKNVLAASHSELYNSTNYTNPSVFYDGLNRLTGFQRGTLIDYNGDGTLDSISGPTQNQYFLMDSLGNVLSDTGVTATRGYNARNQMTYNGANNVYYDDNGNTIDDGAGNLYVYDAWNHLVTVKDSSGSHPTRSTYTTDALGRRITETPSGQSTTTHIYSAQWQVLEDDASGVAKAQYVWSPFYVDDMVLRDRDADTSTNDGGLDSTFNGSGMVSTDINSHSTDSGNAVVILPNGKTVAAGTSNSDFAIARYNVDGTLDTTFNSTGKVTVDIGSYTADEAYAMAVQSDGKIVVAGTSNGDFAVIRLNTDGSLDTTFDGNGKETIDINNGATDAAYAVALSPDGDIYLAGTGGSTPTNAIVRLNSSGGLVSAFNSGGKLTFHTGVSTDSEEIRAAVVSPAGELYVTGSDLSNGKYF